MCGDCGRVHPARLDGVCECGGLLAARYDLAGSESMPRGGAMWSWTSLLPPCEPLTLGEPPVRLIERGDVLYADDGALPTGTFKARGAAVGVAMARALGATGVVLPTAGNAGAAWAAYCAEAGLACAVFAASDAPAGAVDQAREYGAAVSVVDGSIADAGARAAALAAERGWHLAATFREPWRTEGKKTALLEIADALGGRAPDAAVLPVGGGVGVVAWHKALAEARALGWVSGEMRLYAVQAEGCAPIVRAFEAGADASEPWPDPVTSAAGIRIPSPLASRPVLRALRDSGGGAVAVSEAEIAAAADAFAEPVALEAAAAWAGYERLRERGAFAPGETVVVYGTGTRERAARAAG